ncbi:hypothetical protein [Cesiribacter sp. SM1]|uniref:hypothetical protein n=1 Tax=Cesiribacter sp. SM1 TaxID=2861196 RepID=UPI001CD5CB32|nr:hypothetical protein [Cesiribacter sp. SM1]
MYHFFKSMTLGLLLTGVLASCASIFSKSTYPVTINTTPQNVNITISDARGMVVYQGMTPATLPLDASSGYFKPAFYEVSLSQHGYQPQTFVIEAKIDGWYFGNIAIGGFLGMLVIDPLTGAMWRIPSQYYNFTLIPNDEASTKGMRLMLIDEVPSHLRDKLEPIKEAGNN